MANRKVVADWLLKNVQVDVHANSVLHKDLVYVVFAKSFS